MSEHEPPDPHDMGGFWKYSFAVGYFSMMFVTVATGLYLITMGTIVSILIGLILVAIPIYILFFPVIYDRYNQ